MSSMRFLRFLAMSTATMAVVSTHAPPSASANDPCRTGLVPGDTARFVGTLFNDRPGGSLSLWIESSGRIAYRESFPGVAGDRVLEGSVDVAEDATPRRFELHRLDKDNSRRIQTTERVGDSAIVRDNGRRTATALPRGFMPMPPFFPTGVLAVLTQCALARGSAGLQTQPFGRIRAVRASATQLHLGTATKTASLVVLVSDSGPGLGRAWIDEKQRPFAYLNSDVGDALPAAWAPAHTTLLIAEARAAEPRMRQTAAALGVTSPAGVAFIRATVLDVERGTVTKNLSVYVRGSRIQSVVADSAFVVPRGARVVNAAGKVLMPGLWDLGGSGVANAWGVMSDDASRDLLSRGITSIMEDIADTVFTPRIVERINNGNQIGPSVLPACWMNGWVPDTAGGVVPRMRGWHNQVRDERELRHLVKRCGALGIKIAMVTRTFPPELLSALVEESHAQGIRVIGEAIRARSARDLIAAGYDGFSHLGQTLEPFASWDTSRTDWSAGRVGGLESFWFSGAKLPQLDLHAPEIQELVRELVARKLPMASTLCAYPPVNKFARAHDTTFDAATSSKLREYTLMLSRAGAVLLISTAGACTMGRELQLLHDAGLSNPVLLRMATIDAARFAGREADLGSVAIGKQADLILVDGNPLSRISDVGRIAMVMRNGVLYPDSSALRAPLPFLAGAVPPPRR